MQWDRGIAVTYILNQQSQTPIFFAHAIARVAEYMESRVFMQEKPPSRCAQIRNPYPMHRSKTEQSADQCEPQSIQA